MARQQHLDRLSALDASFLAQESAQAHMHIGAVAVCAGPPPSLGALLDHIGGRMHLVPRYRQRLAQAPLGSARPLWVDDAAFRLAFHVHHAALPSPGGSGELREFAARVFSTPLDRGHPLWELWFVEGLADGAFALIFKTHHALLDGRAGVALAQIVFDAEAPRGEEWAPRASPGPLELLGGGAAGLLRTGATLAAGALAAAREPQRALAEARAALDGVGSVLAELGDPAPSTPLNVPIGPHRRLATVACELDALVRIRGALGGTINDVVLAVVTGALRRLLVERGVAVDGLELRALIPVSARRPASEGAVLELGNRVSAMRARLPVGLDEPLARLEAVRGSMAAVKESPQALGAGLLAGALDYTPPALLALLARLNLARRLFNVLVTNIPGPQEPLFVLGCRMLEAYPVAPLPRDHALSVAILSYDGALHFGLLADFDALPEVDRIAAWIGEEIAALEVAAAAV